MEEQYVCKDKEMNLFLHLHSRACTSVLGWISTQILPHSPQSSSGADDAYWSIILECHNSKL